jgi:hypothetical protein
MPSQRDVRLGEPEPSWLQDWDTNNFIQAEQSRRGMLADQMYRDEQGVQAKESLRRLLAIIRGERPTRGMLYEPPPRPAGINGALPAPRPAVAPMPHAMTVRG